MWQASLMYVLGVEHYAILDARRKNKAPQVRFLNFSLSLVDEKSGLHSLTYRSESAFHAHAAFAANLFSVPVV
jgi:hypothetical protein